MVDSEELPFITDKEAQAIACYCALSRLKRHGIISRNADSLSLSQQLQAEWMQLCSSARIPIHLTQNDFNEIADVTNSWDRKIYNKSFKPIR